MPLLLKQPLIFALSLDYKTHSCLCRVIPLILIKAANATYTVTPLLCYGLIVKNKNPLTIMTPETVEQ